MAHFKNKPALSSLINLPVRVYWNSHKRLFSVQVQNGSSWYVAGHAANVQLINCTFTVSAAGHRRALREKVKNVHAFVRGTLVGLESVEIPAAVMDKEGMLEKVCTVVYNRHEGSFQYTQSMARWDATASPQVWLAINETKPEIVAIPEPVAHFEVRMDGECVYRTRWFDKALEYMKTLSTPATVVEVWINGKTRTVI